MGSLPEVGGVGEGILTHILKIRSLISKSFISILIPYLDNLKISLYAKNEEPKHSLRENHYILLEKYLDKDKLRQNAPEFNSQAIEK